LISNPPHHCRHIDDIASDAQERLRQSMTRTSQITVVQGWNPREHGTTEQWLPTTPDQLQCTAYCSAVRRMPKSHSARLHRVM